MTKSLPILDPDRPAQNGTDSMIDWVKSLEIVLPKLSPMALQSASFDFYDKGLKDGEPTAAKIAAGIMALPELDQATAAARRSEWSRSRCVEYLRSEAARLNVELVQIAEKTKSEAVKVAVIDAIYKAILTEYPHLKVEASDMAVRKKLELVKSGVSAALKVKKQPFLQAEPVTETVATQNPKSLGNPEDIEMVRGQLKQISNLAFLALETVNTVLVPACASAGFPLDSQSTHAWSVSLFIEACRSSKAHFRLPVMPL